MTTRTRLTTLSAVAAAAALAVLGVATAQTSGTVSAAAAEPTIESQMVTPTADTAAPAAPMAESAVQPMAAPVAEATPQRFVVIADPAPVAEPVGLTAPLDRAGVRAEFLAMRDAGVLVPAGEAGDTEDTAQRRLNYHQAQADAWTGYQLKLAEVRLARELAWAQQALEEQARAEEAARMQSQNQMAPAVEPPMEAPPTSAGN